MNRTPGYVLFFLLCLVVPQLIALKTQFDKGFRFFGHQPVRVPFSWDMFANRVERCDVRWFPPLTDIRGGLSSIRQLGTWLEWDVIYDRASDYRTIEYWACSVSQGKVKGRFECFLPDGTRTEDEFHCR